jgi:hypothetical protein
MGTDLLEARIHGMDGRHPEGASGRTLLRDTRTPTREVNDTRWTC